MIGQENLLATIDKHIQEGTFPRFAIIVGPEGSGKRLVVKHIQEQMSNVELLEFGTSANDVRDAIKMSYKTTKKALYFFPDSDSMSATAKNALLKVTEEPPNNVYFIMTLESEHNTLDTILSRGTLYQMEPYANLDIAQYAVDTDKITTEEELNIVRDVCSTPGDVNVLLDTGIQNFYNYVEKVVDNIAEVSGANSFKIADKIALKDNAEGYNLKLFWQIFMRVCLNRWDGSKEKRYVDAIEVTLHSLKELNIKGINKSGLFDLWILDVRKEWMKYDSE